MLRSRAVLLSLLCAISISASGAFGATLQISVRHTFGGDPLLPDSLRYENSARETLSVTRLSYLLSGFALQKADGAWIEVPEQFAWMSAEHGHTSTLLENVPPGNYQAIRFYIGLDAQTNAADIAKLPADHPLNPNLNGLHWSWQGGYIFLAIEGLRRVQNQQPGGFAYHLARNANRVCINLTAPLDLTSDAAMTLDFDLAAMLNAPRPLSFEKDGTSTHSRDGDPIAAALVANLPAAFRVRAVASLAPEITKPSQIKPLYLPDKFTPFPFKMSSTFPVPALPRDNPLIEERVALGEKLFHETALSRDNSLSCASCHQADTAFADPRRYSVGVRSQIGVRNAMPLFNLAWKSAFFWDGRAPSLRAQAMVPMQDHTEMDETLDSVVAKLSAKSEYAEMFRAAFGSPEITAEKIGLAIEQFVLTLTSFDSKFDRAMRGQATLDAEEKRGFELFMTEYDPRTRQFGADCFHCHGGPLFSDHQFHNNGLDAEPRDDGRSKITHREADRGKFSTPSLRNVELTAPYMHDGRFATLDEAVAHYSTGVKRGATLDPNLAKHPDAGLQLSDSDKKALVAFLKTLTDPKYKMRQD